MLSKREARWKRLKEEARNPPLTQKKAQWAKGRKVNLIGTQLNHNVSIQQKYESRLKFLVLSMTRETRKEIENLFKINANDSAMDASLGSQARITMNYLTNKFIRLFSKKAKKLAEQMLGSVSKTSKSNLHSSLKKLTGGLSLKTGLITKDFEDIAAATIAENVSLIKSIPQEYFKQVTGSVMRSITEGTGVGDIYEDLRKFNGMTDRRAKNIALDQTRKAYNTINAERLKSLKVKKFEWIHSGGGAQPRESHMKIDGHIFSLDVNELMKEQAALGVPEKDRGLPSIPPNCRCTLKPIIELGE